MRRTLDLPSISQPLCARLSQWPNFQSAKTVLAYCATEDEVSLTALIERWPDKTWGLPRTLPSRLLAWHCYQPPDALQRSKWGILEPTPQSSLINLKSVDIILVPAIACDRQGTRLGYGGGFYDRCLANPALKQATTVGIVPDACWSTIPLPRDQWDVPLAAIATEQTLWIAGIESSSTDNS